MSRTDDLLRRARRLLGRPRATAVLCLGLLAWYLSNLPGSYFVDEVVYVRTGQRMLAGEPYHNPTHIFAPLPKYLIGAGQALLGESEAAARFPMALLAVAPATWSTGSGRGWPTARSACWPPRCWARPTSSPPSP